MSRNPDYPPNPTWDNCDHEWAEEVDSMSERDMRCTKCNCCGERQRDGSVYWPTT